MQFIIPAGSIYINESLSKVLNSDVVASMPGRNIFYAPNSSGKTVLFRWLAGQSDLSAYKLDRFVKISGADVSLPLNKVCAFVPQSARDCLFGLPGHEDLRTAPFIADKNADSDFLIDELQLDSLLNKFTFELSDGEQKRIMVGAALLTRAEWLIMDEWDLHLDMNWKNKLSSIFDRYVQFNRGTLELVSDRSLSSSTIEFSKKDEKESQAFAAAFRMIPPSNMPEPLRHSGAFSTGGFKRVIPELEFAGASITAVIGGNGTGKTTLLRSMRSDKLARSLYKNMAFVLTDPAIQMPVQPISYIIDGLSIEDKEGLKELMQLIGVQKRENAWHLNYARKKLLAVVIQAIKNDKILIIDELKAGLDARSKKIMLDIVSAAKQRGKCVIVTVHSVDQLDGLSVDKKIFL